MITFQSIQPYTSIIEIQHHADTNNMKEFYRELREVYGPSSSGTSPLLSADGATLITDKEKILDRWAEHFESVLNRPSSINNEAIERLPQVPINESMDNVPTLEEIQKAIRQLSSGKAPGSDAIPARMVAWHLLGDWDSYSGSYGSMRCCPRTSRMQPSSTSTRERESDKLVTTIVGFPSSRSQARHSPESFSTA